MATERFYGAAEVARLCGPGVRPRDLSDGFYGGRFDESRCPVVSGRRVIPESYVPTIRRLLREQRQARGREVVATGA